MKNVIKIKGLESEYFKIIKYPDGQSNIKLNLDALNIKLPVFIECSIRNFYELEILLCVVAALKRNDFVIFQIDFYYLFGLRSDRAFEPGMPNYLKDVLIPIIENIGVKKIQLCHPHSPLGFIDTNIEFFYPKNIYDIIINEKLIVIAGDETAKKFLRNTAPGFKKQRSINGEIKISITEDIIKLIKSNPKKGILIFDDMCDGGVTFIEESKIIKELFPDRELFLYVTHGLFSKGIDHVANHFDFIFCTNSYQDLSHPKLKQFEVI